MTIALSGSTNKRNTKTVLSEAQQCRTSFSEGAANHHPMITLPLRQGNGALMIGRGPRWNSSDAAQTCRKQKGGFWNTGAVLAARQRVTAP